MNWSELTTQGRIEAIKAVWQPGMSAKAIASHFDGVSRNAIIGIFHRHADKMIGMYLGVKGENGQAESEAKSLSVKATRKRGGVRGGSVSRNRLRVVKATEPKPVPAVATNPITLMELTGHTCRFPVGEATGEHQLFCGQPCEIDQPYCDHCATLAYHPVGRVDERGTEPTQQAA